MDTKELQSAAHAQLAQITGLNQESIFAQSWQQLIASIDENQHVPHLATRFLLMTTLGALGLDNPRPEDMPKRWAKTPLGNLFLRRWLIEHSDAYITPSEAARRAGSTVQSIRQWANFGRIETIPNPDPPAASLTYFVNAASLQAFLIARERHEDEQ